MGPYGSSGFSFVAKPWKSWIALAGSVVNMSLMATKTAWTVSTLCSLRNRSIYRRAYCWPDDA